MRRIYNKQNRGGITESLKRAQSHSHFTLTQNKTLAQLNHPSTRQPVPTYHPTHPVRVTLPQYFNVPRFNDDNLFAVGAGDGELFSQVRAEAELKRKLRDLGVLAEGMRRAKNIKEESRYYFTQGVLQHNCRAYTDSIASLEKFLKIVLFIRDEKSVELALNSIGAEYMALGQHQTALQYHRKQGSINQRADGFLSHANCGLCYQMGGDFESAIAQYRQAQKLAKLDTNDARRTLVEKLIARANEKKDEVFITAQQKETLPTSSLRDPSPATLLLPRTKKAKIVQAIRNAEEHLDKFLSNMKESYLEDD